MTEKWKKKLNSIQFLVKVSLVKVNLYVVNLFSFVINRTHYRHLEFMAAFFFLFSKKITTFWKWSVLRKC